MKTEKELTDIAAAISAMFEKQKCNHAEISRILHMLRVELYRQICKDLDKREEVHKVKVE